MFLDGDSCYIIGQKLAAEGVKSYAGKTLCGEVMTVYSKDDLRFTLPCKTEIKA
jgi:hypothetical protein